MNVETCIYGLSEFETEQYMETLLYHANKRLTEDQIKKVTDYGSANGWHSFRVAYIDLAEPSIFTNPEKFINYI